MKTIIKYQGTGKTRELIHLAAQEFSYIVCPTTVDVKRIWEQAAELGETIPQPITWNEFVAGKYHGKGIRGFIIDDLDLCVARMSPVEIKAISLTRQD